MAINESTGLKNSKLDGGVRSAFPAGAILELRAGARPANADAAPTGALLASIVLPATPFAAAANGSMAKQGAWSVAAAAAGVVGHYRLRQAADAGGVSAALPRVDGAVTITGGGGDVELDNTNVAAGQVITIGAFTLNG